MENGCSISKDADITVAFRVELPELFTVTSAHRQMNTSAKSRICRKLVSMFVNDLKEIEVCIGSQKSKFTIINMAKLDNIYIVKELLDKFIQDNLWESCTKCEANSKCPIYFNYLLCKEHKDRFNRNA